MVTKCNIDMLGMVETLQRLLFIAKTVYLSTKDKVIREPYIVFHVSNQKKTSLDGFDPKWLQEPPY